MVSVQSKGTCRIFSLANPPPNSTLQEQEDHPDVFYWDIHEFRIEARCCTKQGNKGETNGEANSVIMKRKCGCPPKSKTTGTNHCHFYLEYHNGTLLSSKDITLLSQKARMAWLELNDVGLTPPTFGQMTKITWDFFWCSMVKPKATDTLDDLNLIQLDLEDKDSDTDGNNNDQASGSCTPNPHSDPQGSPLHTSPTTISVQPTDNATSTINAPDMNATSTPNSSPSDAALGQLNVKQPLTPTIDRRDPDLTTVAPAPSPAPVDIGNIDTISKPSQPDTGPMDLGPRDANTNVSKKQKSNNNMPPVAPAKKQKSLGAPAIPTQTNSISTGTSSSQEVKVLLLTLTHTTRPYRMLKRRSTPPTKTWKALQKTDVHQVQCHICLFPHSEDLLLKDKPTVLSLPGAPTIAVSPPLSATCHISKLLLSFVVSPPTSAVLLPLLLPPPLLLLSVLLLWLSRSAWGWRGFVVGIAMMLLYYFGDTEHPRAARYQPPPLPPA
ncbi:hypothetical protein EDB84DRAFT_1445163 [Lactarius hengduanensis]|nr:hypothetical protein EDB84DRAFT_1445163 [Lactarius hengduanensis]